MTPLHRSVPQRRRRNLWPFITSELTIAALVGLLTMPVSWFIFDGTHSPSRLQPALDQIQRFGERKCWSGEVVR